MKKGIILMLICTIFTALGQFFFKNASKNITFSFNFLYNYNLWLGLFFYGIGAILMVVALRFGELNTLYPIVSLTFVWVSLISIFILKDTFSLTKISGIGVIITGVFIIQRGSKK
jgi:drug/metabolite transporter (DMT)-like permease